MQFIVIIFTITFVIADYNCPGGKLTDQERSIILCHHNKLRSDLIHGKLRNSDNISMPNGKNMLKLTWSCDLESSAQSWSDHCILGSSEMYTRYGRGENVLALWVISGVEYYEESAVSEAAKVWKAQLRHYYKNNPKNRFISTHDQEKASFFIQMAWGKTHEIGCGVSKCGYDRALVVACHYRPAGNIVGDLIYELGEPCKADKDCTTRKCAVKSGLCIK
uniref:SCP domain-containing protein n=1 Tax=Setaria digitata TaxID=48799 RepID=A0A915PJG4_9BILA